MRSGSEVTQNLPPLAAQITCENSAPGVVRHASYTFEAKNPGEHDYIYAHHASFSPSFAERSTKQTLALTGHDENTGRASTRKELPPHKRRANQTVRPRARRVFSRAGPDAPTAHRGLRPPSALGNPSTFRKAKSMTRRRVARGVM